MMVYQKIFSEYNSLAAQVLLTKTIVLNPVSRQNAENTFRELSKLGAIPVVNENDTISTSEIEQVQTFGDNDRLSAVVASITDADLLILLSDIDGMYTDDPRTNPDARFIHYVETIDDSLIQKGNFRQQCRNRRYGIKNCRCHDCCQFRSRYGHYQCQ